MQLEVSVFITVIVASGFIGGFIGFLLTLFSLSGDKEFQRVGEHQVIVDRSELEGFINKSKRKRVDEVDEASDFGTDRVENL